MIRRKWWEGSDLLDLELGNGDILADFLSKCFFFYFSVFFFVCFVLNVDAASTVHMNLLHNPLLSSWKMLHGKYTPCSTGIDVGRRREEFVSSFMIRQCFDRVRVVW